MSWKDISGSGGGGMASLVTSVFGRIGDVLADPSDYTLLNDLTMLSETGAPKSAGILANGSSFELADNNTRLTFKNPKNIAGTLFAGFEIQSIKANATSDNTASVLKMFTSLNGTDLADNEFLEVDENQNVNFNTDQMVITKANGYVGIGTANPLSHLHVSHSVFPQFIIGQTSAAANEKLWSYEAQNARLELRTLSDVGNPGQSFLKVFRNSTSVGFFKVASPNFQILTGSIDFSGDVGSNIYAANGSFGTSSLTGAGDPLENRAAYQVTIGHNSDVLGQRVGIAFAVGLGGLLRSGAGIYSNHTQGLGNASQNVELYVNNNTGTSFLGLEVMPQGSLKTHLVETEPFASDIDFSQGIFWLNNTAGNASLQMKLRNSGFTLHNVNLSREQINTIDFDDTTVQNATFQLQAAAYVFTGAAGATNFQLPTRADYLAAHSIAPVHIIRDDVNNLTIIPAVGETIDGAASLALSLGTKSQVTLVPDGINIINWRVLSHATIG